jgi:hypothetical protein
MMRICRRPDCAVHDDLPCEMGMHDFKSCPHFQQGSVHPGDSKNVMPVASADSTDEDANQRLPWTGRALGLADLPLASSRGTARLVGLIGPFNAGKTGLLTAIFAHFARTGSVSRFEFAGSFTLHGWHLLRSYTTWPSPHAGMFPPHTPDNELRVPSLLHLAFRSDTGRLRDMLFSDAPGEWFTRWVKNQDAPEAQGARWIVENATHFVFVVDRAGLASEDVGRVRQNTLALARVLSEHRRGRPIIAAWTKSDAGHDEVVEAPIRQRLAELFGDHASFNVHVEDPKCLEVLQLLLESEATSRAKEVRSMYRSPFRAYGSVEK